MYEELVKRLHQRIALTTAGSPLQDDLREAADAIKELSKELMELEMLTCCCCEPPKEDNPCGLLKNARMSVRRITSRQRRKHD